MVDLLENIAEGCDEVHLFDELSKSEVNSKYGTLYNSSCSCSDGGGGGSCNDYNS